MKLREQALHTILKPWAFEESKNQDKKVNKGAFCDAKKLYLAGRDYSPVHE